MIVTVFRHRLNPDTRDEYARLLTRIVELSKTSPAMSRRSALRRTTASA